MRAIAERVVAAAARANDALSQVPFAGYELPVQYEGVGVLKEHMHCRAPGKASVFDVGHMGQIKRGAARTREPRRRRGGEATRA